MVIKLWPSYELIMLGETVVFSKKSRLEMLLIEGRSSKILKYKYLHKFVRKRLKRLV